MKKLMEDKLGKTSSIYAREAETYHIEVGQSSMEALSNTSHKVIIRGAQAIRGLTRWNDHVDITTIKTYLVGKHVVDMSTKASVEIKRGRVVEDEEAEEPASKKKSPNGRGAVAGEGPTNCTRQTEGTGPSISHLGSVPLSKDKWEEGMNKEKGKEKEDATKEKKKT
jgi:hypothetical protein